MGYNPFSADDVRIERQLQLQKLQSVTEAYVGKSENLKKAEKLLDIMLRRDRSAGELARLKTTQESTPENKQFEKLIEKEFGFRKFSMHWLNNAVPNAYTMTGGLLVNKNPDPENISTRGNKRYYDAKHEYMCFVAFVSALAIETKLTADEAMAIILHEIGHNFDSTMATHVMKFADLAFTYGLSEFGSTLHNMYLEIVKGAPWLHKLISIREDLMWYLNVLPISLNAVYNMLMNPYQLVFGMFLIPSEKFADTLPVMYGYGESFASAMRKLNDPTKVKPPLKKAIYKVPILRTFYDLMETSAMTAVMLFNCHPYTMNRIIEARKNLEKDYKNPEVPKALKPEIKRQIEAIEKIENVTLEDSLENQRYMAYFRDLLFKKADGKLMPPAALMNLGDKDLSLIK